MNFALFLLIITFGWTFSLAIVQSSTNPKMRSTDVSTVISRRGVLSWIPATALTFSTFPAVANASPKDVAKEEKTIYGVYLDPRHPKGYRVITGSGTRLRMQLQDNPNGRVFTIPIKKTKEERNYLIDFSPKGGPKNLIGIFENTGGGKILYPDGNEWTKLNGVAGVYNDPNHPNGYRIVRREDGNSFVVELNDSGSKGKEITIPARSSGNSIVFDFSVKGGPKELIGSIEDGIISFPDGNKWTKL